MARRIHVPELSVGEIPLDAVQAHHARDVLRLAEHTLIEVFDDHGAVATGTLLWNPSPRVRIDVISAAHPATFPLTIASAVPKGDRADWMIEKLSELGVSTFIPLAAARSVVLPEGKGKRERWTRIATESAKQSRRPGVMKIENLTPLPTAIETATKSRHCWCLSTAPGTTPATPAAIDIVRSDASLTAFVGPEGGWTDDELALFQKQNASFISLGTTILRIETAAIAFAAIVAASSLDDQTSGREHRDDLEQL